MSQFRAIKPINMAGVVPGGDCVHMPEMIWVDPKDLVVDETYQRNLSERSVTLIRKIVSVWDWRQFKSPTVTKGESGFEVIDGQHTAIAAASHPNIEKIPVLLTEKASIEAKAAAFVGVNRNRVALLPGQIFYASLAAGDEDARTVAQVAERANLKILKYPPSYGRFKPGETLAIASVQSLIKRRGAMRAREALQILVAAQLGPVRVDHIKAVEYLLHEPEYAGEFKADDLSLLLRAKGDDLDREAKIFAASHKLPVWRGLAVQWFRKVKHGRRAAA